MSKKDSIQSNDDFKFHLINVDTGLNQFEIFSKLYHSFENAFILESLHGPKELAEMSIIGFDPTIIISCTSKKFIVHDKNLNKKIVSKVTEPIDQLKKFLPKINNKKYRFIGGAVGYISYEAIHFWERLPQIKKNEFDFPIIEFGIYNDGILYDHLKNKANYFYIGEKNRLEIINDLLKQKNTLQIINKTENKIKYTRPKRNISRSEFISKVKKAKKYIYDGDIFQVVLSKKYGFEIYGDLLKVYDNLREINPSPYMYFLKMGNRNIIGSSPEMLVRITGNMVETFPIAGTRPIVKDEEENKRLSYDLLHDEKELAEHTMLVDLARNDVGKICEFGSVNVKDLMRIKRFSHVQHIVSHVTGKIDRKKYDSFDALKAVFPAGTVSGAPKVRAMEIINELEPNSRQVYSGALGYFSFNGCMDFAIIIRSLFVSRNKGFVQSGAGIVMDSDPVKEWNETEHKANVIFSALGRQ